MCCDSYVVRRLAVCETSPLTCPAVPRPCTALRRRTALAAAVLSTGPAVHAVSMLSSLQAELNVRSLKQCLLPEFCAYHFARSDDF